jgi:hypothetical protein
VVEPAPGRQYFRSADRSAGVIHSLWTGSEVNTYELGWGAVVMGPTDGDDIEYLTELGHNVVYLGR